ncbi:MAG: hypothetical protein U0793_30760 [Gemmataceae bacterium]
MRFYSLVAAGLTAGGCLFVPVESRADDPSTPREVQIHVGPLHIDAATGQVWYDPWPYAYPYANPTPDSATLTFHIGDLYYQFDYNPQSFDRYYRWDPRFRPFFYGYPRGYRR